MRFLYKKNLKKRLLQLWFMPTAVDPVFMFLRAFAVPFGHSSFYRWPRW